MSRDDTAGRTRQALENAGVRVLDLPELTDIDHFADALAVADRCGPLSRTRSAVEKVTADLASAAHALLAIRTRRGPGGGGGGGIAFFNILEAAGIHNLMV